MLFISSRPQCVKIELKLVRFCCDEIHWQSDFGSHWYERLLSKFKQNRSRPEYYLGHFCCWNSERTRSTTWLLMTRLLASPGRRQHWLHTIGNVIVSFEDWHQPPMPFLSVIANFRKNSYTFLFSKKKNSTRQRLNCLAQCGHDLSY